MIKTAILTISDSRTRENDLSGKAMNDILGTDKFTIASYEIIRDDKEQIKTELLRCVNELKVNLILTSGGTGLGPRDVTPDATLEVIDKQAEGISEFIRLEGVKKTTRSILSRAVAGVKGNTLIINLPGSPKGVEESLKSILDIIPHALDMISGMGHS